MTVPAGISPYFLFVPSTVCAFLAYWQYERKQWKEDLLTLRKMKLQEPAVDVFAVESPEVQSRVAGCWRAGAQGVLE